MGHFYHKIDIFLFQIAELRSVALQNLHELDYC